MYHTLTQIQGPHCLIKSLMLWHSAITSTITLVKLLSTLSVPSSAHQDSIVRVAYVRFSHRHEGISEGISSLEVLGLLVELIP